ncbi:trichothecene 3-o-acetyltransferase [Fusarium beomiforme]|uniref:Trichothecene 3-o-acetyltransferase n=1 Tax=Fusarium beomiforme TaxID=44412 RepID=A0A9P5AER7_9HYPO|nr:trichothecene 3-o-acetyltransferase [Fusarium beomiforme]
MASLQVINVKPLGARLRSPDEIFQLSDLDHLMPKIYVHMIEIFELPQTISKNTTVDNLVSGLERTLADYPILSAVLDKHDFPVHLLDASKALPDQFNGDHFPVPGRGISGIGLPVGRAQVTFIEGGVILGLAITHQVCDGPGFENLLTWSRYTTIAANGDSLDNFTAALSDILLRSILSLKNKLKLISEELEKLGAKFPIMKLRDGPPAPPPADFKMPVNMTVAEAPGDLETTLPVLARVVRESTNSVTPEYIADLIKYVAGSSNLQWSKLDMNSVLGLDCIALDWHTVKLYQSHNFGFGKPAALRWPHPNFEGFFFVLHSRAGVGNQAKMRLEKDEEFAKYAEQKGLGV